MALPPGYTKLRTLPPGGTSDLIVARHPDYGRVVVRSLQQEYARSKKWRRLFAQGAYILSGLDHPNVVHMIDDRPDASPPYMITEYIPGSMLRSLVLNRDPVIEQNYLHLLRQMAAALYYVHSMGYVHLDFKPDNLMITGEVQIKLIDFDLACERPRDTVRRKDIDGTVFYLPPEALLRHEYGEQTDIFAFGVTAYEMINHHKPFSGSNPRAARAAQSNPRIRPTPLNREHPCYSRALESLIGNCLAKDPAERYPSTSLVQKAIMDLV